MLRGGTQKKGTRGSGPGAQVVMSHRSGAQWRGKGRREHQDCTSSHKGGGSQGRVQEMQQDTPSTICEWNMSVEL